MNGTYEPVATGATESHTWLRLQRPGIPPPELPPIHGPKTPEPRGYAEHGPLLAGLFHPQSRYRSRGLSKSNPKWRGSCPMTATAKILMTKSLAYSGIRSPVLPEEGPEVRGGGGWQAPRRLGLEDVGGGGHFLHDGRQPEEAGTSSLPRTVQERGLGLERIGGFGLK
jgi:hypothetical protein